MNQELRTIPELLDYLQVLRRRAFIILGAAIIVPLVATFLVSRQPALYRSSADVLLNRQDIAASLTNVTDPTLYDATRNAQTQARVARVPEIATRVVEELDLDRTSFDFLDQSSVSASEDADVLTFLVTDANPKLTPRLATEYARQFTIYRSELDTRELKGAREAAESRLESLRLGGRENSAPYATLEDVVEKLRTLETLYTSRAILIRPAVGAVQIQPKVFRAGMIGVVLGIVLGLLFAFLAEALDTRVRSEDSLSTKLGLPVLGRIPKPPRSARRDNRLVMMTTPNGRNAEPYRMLRTNLDFVNLEVQPRTIAVTSAVAGEGKSTTAANLAVSLARTGRRVLIADFDVRAPSLDRLFNLGGRPGLTNVVLGKADLSDAIAQIALPDSARRDNRDEPGLRAAGNAQSENGSPRTDQALAADLPGVLDVLLTGPVPPNPGEFLTSHRVTAILDEVRTKYDVILIDAAPLLQASETLALLRNLDAFLLVARLDRLRSWMLADLQRILHTSPAPALGFVLTAAKLEAGYAAYGDYSTADIASDVAMTTEPSEDEMSQGPRALLSRWVRPQR